MSEKTRWSKKDIRIMRKLFREDHTDEQIAEALGRSEKGVLQKRSKLGIYRRNFRGRSPRQRASGDAPGAGRGAQTTDEYPYAVIVRGPNRELAMAVDPETGHAVLQLMLGIEG
jgi:hypothetical protein